MRRVLVLAVALLLIAAGGTAVYQAARERDYRNLLARGDAALAADQTFTAVEAYSGAIALRPDSMLPHLRRGETYERRGELEAAARDFRAAATLDPTAPRALNEWGDVLYQLNRFRRAAETYGAYLALDDRATLIHYKRALASYRAGDTQTALDSLERAVTLDPASADAYYLMGMCLRDLDRPSEALSALEHAVLLSPGLVAAREELADAYAQAGRPADELEQLQVLAGLDRDNAQRQIAVSRAHARAGHVDLAVLTLSNALERSQGQPALYEALGQVWLEIARKRNDRVALGKALAALARGAASPGASSEMLLLYGEALGRDGQLEASEQVLQQAASREPVEPTALRAYAAAAERAGHLPEARRALVAHWALTADEGGVDELARIGDLSARLSDSVAAASWYSRALERSPHNTRLIAGLATAQIALGLREEAADTLEDGLEREPDNGRLLALAEELR